MSKLAVLAIGGNSLIKDKQHETVEDQYDAVCETAKHIAGMIEQGYDLVVTHGNGPQVGQILSSVETAYKVNSSNVLFPFDVCGSFSQGYITIVMQNIIKIVISVSALSMVIIFSKFMSNSGNTRM